jgi:VIT1/CCC1 family predicted Fe2+/Mn2+ transporter
MNLVANPHSSGCGSSRESTKPEAPTSLSILQGKDAHMKHIIPAMAVAAVLTLGVWTPLSAEEENEQTVKMSDLPAAVQTTIKDKAGSSEIIKIEKKTENGQTVYEAVVNKSGKEWSIEVDANGKFLKQYEESKEKEEKGENY